MVIHFSTDVMMYQPCSSGEAREARSGSIPGALLQMSNAAFQVIPLPLGKGKSTIL